MKDGYAHFSPMTGRGVIYAGGQTYIISPEEPFRPRPAGNTHIKMWMSGPSDIQEAPSGKFPFPKLCQTIKKAHGRANRSLLRQLREDCPEALRRHKRRK